MDHGKKKSLCTNTINFLSFSLFLLSHLLQSSFYSCTDSRAFSDLFGKFLVPMKLGKNCMIWGKNMTILGKYCAIFSKIGKVYLLNWDFSANWECSRSIGNFFQPIRIKFGTGNRTHFSIEKKPWTAQLHIILVRRCCSMIRAVAGQRSSPDLCFATTSVKIYDP